MNTLLLIAGVRPWSAPSWLSALTRVFVVVSVLSVELQLVTWLGVGSLRTLVWVNVVVAFAAAMAWRPRQGERIAAVPAGWPRKGALALGALVVVLNLGLPLATADPYHLEKVARIEATGTLAYDPAADPKINILGSLYELVLADLGQIPLIGSTVVRLHGLWGLLLYIVALGSVRDLLSARFDWRWSLLLVVPVVFHQLVLIKNDLFVGVLGLVVLAWIVTRSRSASWWEIVWAAWLTGLAVAVKLSNLPLFLIMLGGLLAQRWEQRRSWIGAAVLGGAIGAAAGGLLFTVVENLRLYGSVMPLEGIGDRHETIGAALTGLLRFVVSLFDLGLVTPTVWPGRGSWGSTFGLPLVWSLAVLALAWRRSPEARLAVLYAGLHFAMFSLVFPDADISHRIVLGAGVLLVCVALHVAASDARLPRLLTVAVVPILVLSGAQIARSAVLYWLRS